MPATSLKILEDELSFDPCWLPGSDSPIEPRVNDLEFGDGYRQLVKDGINNLPRRWNLTLEALSANEAREVSDFLVEHAGWKSFLFRPPGWEGEDPDTLTPENVTVRARTWNRIFLQGGAVSISVELEERFI